jgi:hypothetical protein
MVVHSCCCIENFVLSGLLQNSKGFKIQFENVFGKNLKKTKKTLLPHHSAYWPAASAQPALVAQQHRYRSAFPTPSPDSFHHTGGPSLPSLLRAMGRA